MAETELIRADSLSKRYGDNLVLKKVTLAVSQREVVCVVGPSGSGKTTLLRCLALLETPSEGRVVMNGETISAPSSDSNI